MTRCEQKTTICSLAALGVLACFFSVPGRAQVAGATLSGTITDPANARVPNATITVKNVATGVTRQLFSDTAGFYTLPNLLAGEYEVTISVPGFETQMQTGIHLTVGSQQVLNFELKVGQVTERLQVTGAAPAVQLADSSLSAVVNSTTVRELPLNGRSWTDLATLQPGVNSITTQFAFGPNVERGNRGFGDQISINGARPQQNNYRLDGVNINDRTNGGPGSVLGGNLGVDAIQEFSVVTSNQPAEYGRTSGGVVNAVTRSGTNQFHGGGYEFLRNSAMDARNFFDGSSVPPFRRNQFGADAGGPVIKNKVFFFADYEGIRQATGITYLDTVPSAAVRTGLLCSAPDPNSGCAPTQVKVDPAAQKFLTFWPAANRGPDPGTNGDIGFYAYSGQQVINEDFVTTREDARLSDKDSLYGTYLHDVAPFTSPDPLGDILIQNETWRQVVAVEETHTFSPALVNSARFGYSYSEVINVNSQTALNPLAQDPSLAAMPGNYAPQIRSVPGLTQFGGGITKHPTPRFWHSYQGYDDAFWIHGRHSIKFGAGTELMHDDSTVPFSTNGEFFFGSLKSFLLNEPTRFLGHIMPPGTTADTVQQSAQRQALFALYAQDDWRLRPYLTLNLGLRWEAVSNPTQLQGAFLGLAHLTDVMPRAGAYFSSDPTLRNFEPRVGFAWDPFHNGKTSVRGSVGIFDVLPLPYLWDASGKTTYPTVQNGYINSLPPGTFPGGAFPLISPQVSNTATYQDGRRSYIMQSNFTIQRELRPNLTATLGYVGSRGTNMPLRVDDADTVVPVWTSAGFLFPSPVGSGTKLNPAYSQITSVFFDGVLDYHALQAAVQERLSHGFQLQGSFTWGKSIDTGSGSVAGDQFSNGISSLPAYSLQSIRGLSDYNVGRTLVINGVWDVPTTRLPGVAGWLTNGWELGAIFKVSDGVPFTPTWGTGGDPSGLNNADDWAYPTRLTGPGCQTAVNPGDPNNYIRTQCFAVPSAPTKAFYDAHCDSSAGVYPQCFNLRGNSGRNILIGPGITNLDFSLFKNNYVRRISESFNVQFRAEFFNILNHPNFALPTTPSNTDIFDASGAPTGVAGLITSTAEASREFQFAIKVIF